MPCGALMAVTEEPGEPGENSSSPSASSGFAGGARQQLGVLDQLGHAELLDVLERGAEGQDQAGRRRPARFAGVGALLFLLEIEVVVGQVRGFGEAPGFGLMVRKARPGGIMKAFCEPPITTSRPQPSMSSGMVPKPVMASIDEDGVRLARPPSPWRAHRARRRWRFPRPARRRRARPGLAASAASTPLGRNHVAVFGLEHDGIQPESRRHLDPALAEFAGRADDHLVAAREQVRDGGFHRAGARGTEHQNVVGGAQHFFEVFECCAVDLAEILGPMMDVRRHHGLQSAGV